MKRARHIVFFGALACGVVIIGNAYCDPHIQFTSPDDNDNAVALACLIPTIMALVGLPVRHLGLRIAFRVGLAGLALVGLLGSAVFTLGSIIAGGGPDLINWIPTGRHTIAVYLRLPGTPSEESGVVDQVCEMAPGLVFSRHVRQITGVDSVAVLTPTRIRVGSDTVSLRPLLGPLC